jgi:hypothetical protein
MKWLEMLIVGRWRLRLSGILAGCIIYAGCSKVVDPAYVSEGQAYVEGVVPVIGSTWSPEELLGRADTDVLTAGTIREVTAACAKELGPLKQAKVLVASGSASVGTPYTGRQASYVMRLEGAKADAELTITVAKINATWKIKGFWVSLPPRHDKALASWTPEKVSEAIEACTAGFQGAVPLEGAARACQCVVAEMQRRWATPQEYAQDTERHNKELVDSGASDRCKAQVAQSPEAGRYTPGAARE